MRLFDITAAIRLPLCDRIIVKYFRFANKICQRRYIFIKIFGRLIQRVKDRTMYDERFQYMEKAEQTHDLKEQSCAIILPLRHLSPHSSRRYFLTGSTLSLQMLDR